MDAELALSIIAIAAAIAAAVYAVRTKGLATNPLAMSSAERACFAWNNEYRVGTWIAYEPEPFDPVAGRIAVRTLSKAYVRGMRPVIDVEQFKTIELDGRVHAI